MSGFFSIFSSNSTKVSPTDPCTQRSWTALGAGIKGVQTSQNIGTNERALVRNTLRNAYNNVCNFKSLGLPNNGKTTPFRITTNSGDPNSTVNQNPSSNLPSHNMVNGIQGNLTINRAQVNGTTNNGGAYYTGNPRYVYDSSNYIRYRKDIAIQKNYNDSTDGGNYQSTVANTLMRIRH